MKLIEIDPSEAGYFGKSARFIDGMGVVVDSRRMKRQVRRTMKGAVRDTLNRESDDSHVSDVWGYGTPKRST